MNKFDKLFEDFFNKRKPSGDPLKDELRKIIESVANFKGLDMADDSEMLSELGEPSEVQEYEEEGLFFKKLIWHLPHGTLVKVIVSDVPHSEIEEPKELTLEEKLNEAVLNEDYELAVELRDKIANTKRKTKKSLK